MIQRHRAGFWVAGISCLLVGFAAPACQAVDGRPTLRVGARAPIFEGVDDEGATWKSSEHVGRYVLVVYFFPGDGTSTGSSWARRFNQDYAELKSRGVELIGVSGDSADTHRQFKQLNDLDFTLLADEDGRIAERFGVRVTPGGVSRPRNPQNALPSPALTLGTRVFAIDLAGEIAFSRPKVTTLSEINVVFEQLAKDHWRNREDRESRWIPSRDSEWKRLLTRQQYLVTRRKQTERPFTGDYYKTKVQGSYRCVGCGLPLFYSTTKFQSGTGWPSFWSPAAADRLIMEVDRSLGVRRMEVKCSRCDAHLGHVFNDGPRPTGHRYCINSAALVLEPAGADSAGGSQ